MTAIFPYLPGLAFPVGRVAGNWGATREVAVSGKKSRFENRARRRAAVAIQPLFAAEGLWKGDVMQTEEDRLNMQVAAVLAAPSLFQTYAFAGLILALAEKRSIDCSRLFAIFETIAQGLESGSVQPIEAARTAAEMMRSIEGVIGVMTTIPQGAGHA